MNMLCPPYKILGHNVPFWYIFCSQHFKCGGSNSHVSPSIQELDEPEAVFWVKKLMIYGMQYAWPGHADIRYMNPWLTMQSHVVG